jgi:hypothetical protein
VTSRSAEKLLPRGRMAGLVSSLVTPSHLEDRRGARH